MRRNDEAMSELLGYTVLVAVVSIASVGILAGSLGPLSAAEKHMEYAGSVSALGSLKNVISGAIDSNNTYYAAYEFSVPPGYDLVLRDKHDDFRSLAIYSNSGQLAFLPIGSITLRSPFRTAAFEGGAVVSNETGLVKAEKSPQLSMVRLPSGKKALYMSVTSISCGSYVRHAGPVTLFIKCSTVSPMSWHVPDGATVTIVARSGDPGAWQERFESCGFATTRNESTISATSGEVSEIYVVYAEADVKAGGR